MQTKKECWMYREYVGLEVIGNLHKHHIFGGSLRKVSEAHGFTVWLTAENHTGNNPHTSSMRMRGVHHNPQVNLELKQRCQAIYEKTHTRAEWMALVGKNYRED